MKIHILGNGITGQAVQKKVQELSDYELADINNADLIIASPGIHPQNYPKTNKLIISEIEFAYRLFNRPESKYKPKLIAVTGTNGKTTVTSLIAHILNIPATGNIGIPLITYVDSKIKSEWLAIEVSSYQLEACSTFKPEIAVWLNLTEDHLLRHNTISQYAEAKAKIFHNQTPDDYVIYPENDPIICNYISNIEAKAVSFSENHPIIHKFNSLQLIGEHNKLNALAAFLAAQITGTPEPEIINKIHSLPPVEHRIELVRTYQNRSIYNDSKATNPDSTVTAVQAFQKPINLILCGKDKNLNLNDFIQFLHQKVKNIVVFGEIKKRFSKLSNALNPEFPLYESDNMSQALKKTLTLSQENEVILFSPSCSSFDQFKNFEERGNIFKKKITSLK
ncbi:UDP-N-acetylmuramoyl-L-alanine--D-glutamate ligase [Candidatus Margulisiibacteriota bacterium]